MPATTASASKGTVLFKQDVQDGQFKVTGANPRFWRSLQLAIMAGVDFPYLLYKIETDGAVEMVTEYREGVRCRWLLPGDILDFIFNPERFWLEASFFDSSGNNRQDDFLSWQDTGSTFCLFGWP